MGEKWITHDGSGSCPEKASRFEYVDVINVDEGDYPRCLCKAVYWPSVGKWRPASSEVQSTPVKDVQDTLSERGKTHGAFDTQAATAQALKDIMRSSPNWEKLTPYQREALETDASKISRILHGNPNEPDHWRDKAGYATLVENLLIHGKSHLK